MNCRIRVAGIVALASFFGSLAGPALAEPKVVAIGRPAAASAVPKWDARGTDLLPWQGIACLDLSADGSLVAVGTLAPPGDPNVFVLDRDGTVASQHAAGQRWIGQVAMVPRQRTVLALSTTPNGHAGDRPTVFVLSSDDAAASGRPDARRSASAERWRRNGRNG